MDRPKTVSAGRPGSTEPCAPVLGRNRNGRTQNSSCGDSRLVVRWCEEALQFVESLAAARARDAPPALFHSAALV